MIGLKFFPTPLSWNSKRICNNSAPWCSVCKKILSTYFYVTPILYVQFDEILWRRTRDNENPKILGKCHITVPPSGWFALKYNKHIFFITKILPIKFDSILCSGTRDLQVFLKDEKYQEILEKRVVCNNSICWPICNKI